MFNQKYGKWLVVERVNNGRSGTYVLARCECGTEKIHYFSDLKTGRSKQCTKCQYKMLYDPEKQIGKRYGKWTIIRFIDIHRKLQRFECWCDCGTRALQLASELRSGKSKQCTNCHNREVAKFGKYNPKGRKFCKDSLEYSVWSGMHRRCKDEKFSRYKDYGGRGITVCARWESFENFKEDMGPRPLGYSIDRIDVNGNYEPGNCRWVTIRENCNNTRKRDKKDNHG